MLSRPPVMRPENHPLRAHPRRRLLLAALSLVLLVFLATLPWQVRNWREAAAIRRDTARQQAQLQEIVHNHAAHPEIEAHLQLIDRLVVAVQQDLRHRVSGHVRGV